MNLFIHNWLVRLFSLIAVVVALYLVIWLEQHRSYNNSHPNKSVGSEVVSAYSRT